MHHYLNILPLKLTYFETPILANGTVQDPDRIHNAQDMANDYIGEKQLRHNAKEMFCFNVPNIYRWRFVAVSL